METEIIDRLYLELSQVTTARTKHEMVLLKALTAIVDAPEDTDGTLSMKMRLIAKEAIEGRYTPPRWKEAQG